MAVTMIAYFYTQSWYIILLLLASVVQAIYIEHPNVDLTSLDKLVIAGSYTGISIFKDTDQLTHVQQDTSSVISLSNDTLKLAASSNVNGTIYSSCLLSDSLYFAGNFTSVNGMSANNIASINLTTNQIQPLKYGLDGPVYSIYCDKDKHQVVVGGSFFAPIDTMINHSESLAQFGGSVAVWKNNQWSGLPWKGFDGPVYSIIKKSNSSALFFGGHFDTTTDGQLYHAPASQPIAISPSGVVGFNTSSISPEASSIICADETNENPWTLADNTTGTWQALFQDYSVNPSLIRIVNSKLDNHQTKGFSVRSLSDASVYELTYLDLHSNTTKTCSKNCILSNNPDVTYQDFRFTKFKLSSGIAIDIHSWYGISGGLASVKVFQSEIFTYAPALSTTNSCKANSSRNGLPKIVTKGTWTTSSSAATPFLTSVIASGENPTITFYPNLVESGTYDVLLYSPPCIKIGCQDRTFVDIKIQQTSSSVSSKVTASEAFPNGIPIFTGYFEVSDSFSPSLMLSLASNITLGTDETVSIVAYAIQFIKVTSNAILSSFAAYDSEHANEASRYISWNPLNDNMPYQASIYSMASIHDSIYVGGSFSSMDNLGFNYSNIVEYNTHSNTVKALPGGGVDGTVKTIIAGADDVYVGGSFLNLANNFSSKALNHVARYNAKTTSWHSLDGGVDGPVVSLNWLHGKETVLISGEYTQFLPSDNVSLTMTANGSAFWNTSSQQFETHSNLPYLTGIVYSTLSYNTTEFFIGDIGHAQRYKANDLSFTSSTTSDTLSFFHSFDLLGKHNTVHINTVYVNKTESGEVVILGGQFDLGADKKNIAIYENDSWQGFQRSDWQGEVNALTAHGDLLFVGGDFIRDTVRSLAAFSLANKSMVYAPAVEAADASSYVNVNFILLIPQENTMVVGGSFGSVDSISCVSICAMDLDSNQWAPLAPGIDGNVIDAKYVNNTLMVIGNITLNGTPLPVARYDFNLDTWSPIGEESTLLGPSQAISYDNVTHSLYVSGVSDGTSYLCKWNGEQFVNLDHDLGTGSAISNLVTLPLERNNSTEERNILLASGLINLGTYNVSSAFYDDKQGWIPYLVTSDADGGSSASSLRGFFYMDEAYLTSKRKNPTTEGPKQPLAVSLVILISIAISMCIVFLLVALGMLIVYFQKKADSKNYPGTKPHNYYSNPPASPEATLAMLKVKPFNKDNRRAAKGRSLKKLKKRTSLYNLGDSTGQRDKSLLSLISVAATHKATRRAPSPPAHTNRQTQIHNQSLLGSLSQNTTSFSSTRTSGISPVRKAKTNSMKLRTFIPPFTDIQRHSEPSSFYSNEYTHRQISESQKSFSPYSNSEVGAVIKEEGGKSSILPTADMINQQHEKDLQLQLSYGDPPPTSAVSYQSESVKWTTTPVANMGTAIVKPVSLISSSDGSSLAGSSLRVSTSIKRNSKGTKFIEETPISAYFLNRGQSSIPRTKNNITCLAPNALDSLPPTLNVVQTNQTIENALDHTKIESMISVKPTLHSYYGLSNTSDSEDLWNDPDLLTYARRNNDVLSGDSDDNPPSSSTWRQMKTFTSLADAGAAGAAAAFDFKEITLSAHHIKDELAANQNDLKINTDVFRVSDAGSVIPPVEPYTTTKHNSIKSPPRWKTPQIGSPIETANAPNILEPSSVAVTSRTGSFIRRQSEMFNTGRPGIQKEKDPMLLKTKKQQENAQERDSPIPTKYISDTNHTTGRATSKRMVEKYLSSRNNTISKKWPRYKSGFRCIMQAAMGNNANTLIASEEHPHLYYAKFNFLAREQGELGFEKDDPIIVIDSSDDIWWWGYKANKIDDSYIMGVFPSNYVEMAVKIRQYY